MFGTAGLLVLIMPIILAFVVCGFFAFFFARAQTVRQRNSTDSSKQNQFVEALFLNWMRKTFISALVAAPLFVAAILLT